MRELSRLNAHETEPLTQRSESLFSAHKQTIFRRTDRLFAGLMFFQWLAGVAAALWIAPRTWEGHYSQIHPHVWAAVLLGGAIVSFPILLAFIRPGAAFTRHTIAVAQMLFAALLIHLTGGRIETHFHVFGSLAFLAFYRDWRVLISATVVVAGDHFIRGIYWPQSVYGTILPSQWRWLEHAGWVIFEDLFLIRSCIQSVAEMHAIARRQADLEATNETVRHNLRIIGESEARVRESEERYRNLFENVPIGLYRSGVDGRPLMANKTLFQLLGCENAAEIPGFGESASRATFKYMIDRDSEVKSLESEWTRKDGSMITIRENARAIRSEDNSVLYYEGTVEDVTERKRSEMELKKAKEAAEAANRAKSEFLASMSHELRTPLNAIIGYSELLQEEAGTVQPEFLSDLGNIRTAGKHLLGLINDILDLSKIEAGKMQLHVERFYFRQLVDQVVKIVQPTMAKKDCRLVVNCAEDVGIMNADLIKMRQILYNLLSNAVKFTEKGTIEIAVDRKSEPDGDWIQFRVSDTGIGMSQEQMTRLFQPFTQADPSTTLKYGGTGLGLAISRSICRMMKGEINAESVLGSGSTFTVRLPADVASTPATAVARQTPDGVMASSSPSSEVPSEKTVLIIDDDSLSREVTARILKHEGFSSVWASNGQDGVRLAREVHPIAITLDVVLPGMDGWAVLTALKSDADLARIPVIMLTMTDDEGFGDALGAAEYLIKPIHSARLVEVVKKHALRKPKADAAEPEAVAHV